MKHFHVQCWVRLWCDMSRLMTKPTKKHLRPAKTQISLGICPVWSESSLCAQWVAKDPSFLHAYCEDRSDQADAQADLSSQGAHAILLVLSWGSSFLFSDIPVIEYMKTLGPSAIDLEIRSLTPEAGGSVVVMTAFLKFIRAVLQTKRNFEIAQAYLGLFLKVL